MGLVLNSTVVGHGGLGSGVHAALEVVYTVSEIFGDGTVRLVSELGVA